MSSYVCYPEYKPSNIEWLDDIPNHWDVKRLRHVLSEPLSNGLFKKKEQWGKGHRIVNVFDVYVDGNVVDEETLDRVNCSIDEYRKYSAQHGDFFCVRSSLKLEGVGKSAVVLAPVEQLVFECHLVRGRPDNTKTDPKYLCYFLNSEYSRNTLISLSNQVTMTTLDQEKFKSLGLSLPPVAEQKAIVSFLDHKTAQIDALIAKKESLLTKLAEKRTALISHAVTKGLDPTVPMKDSGVAWSGDIPAHWAKKRLRFCMRTNPSKSEILLDDDALVSFVPMEAVSEYGGLRLDLEKELSDIGSGYTYFAENDVVVAKITPCFENGKGAIAKGLKNGVAYGTTELHVLRASVDLLPEYLFHLTMSYPFKMIGESEMYGAGGQKRVPESFLKDFKIGLPPINEQHKIVNYINEKHRQLGNQTSNASVAIEKLKEYSSALITNAVTGKIDVRNITIPSSGAADA